MRDLLLITAFVFIFAYLQAKLSKRILRYNANLTTTQAEKKDKGTYMIIAMIVMMVLAMFRGISVGSDTNEYHKIFINVISNPDYANITRFELGYIFLNKLVGKFTTNPQGIIICSAMIYYPVYIWFLRKHSKNYSISLLFFYLMCFGSTLNILRQELAIAFLLIAYDRLINKKIITSYFWIIIAFLFHKSAILFIIIPILPYIRFSKILAIILAVLVIILTATNGFFRFVEIIAPQYSHYFDSQMYSGTGSLSITYLVMRNVIFFVLIFMVISKIKDNRVIGISKLNNSCQRNLIAWLALIPAIGVIFGYRISLIDRIISYFSTFYIILMPNALRKYDQNAKKALTFLIILIMTVYLILGQIFRPEWNIIYPYSFFWET
ncbi:MAG: EpsG family protein [Clostridia bacterium]|nr:EpsG family protein [Clostridia bacterium]